MDIELVIGDRDAFAVERQLNFFKQIKTQIPIVGVLAPDAQQEHDRRFPLLVDHDAGGPDPSGPADEPLPIPAARLLPQADRRRSQWRKADPGVSSHMWNN